MVQKGLQRAEYVPASRRTRRNLNVNHHFDLKRAGHKPRKAWATERALQFDVGEILFYYIPFAHARVRRHPPGLAHNPAPESDYPRLAKSEATATTRIPWDHTRRWGEYIRQWASVSSASSSHSCRIALSFVHACLKITKLPQHLARLRPSSRIHFTQKKHLYVTRS